MQLIGVPLLLALALSSTALAADGPQGSEGGRFALGITGGTLGVGPELSYRFTDHIGVRGSLGWLSIGREQDVDDIDYDGDLDLLSFGGMLDVYPFGGGFRLSGGVRWVGNEINLRASPTNDVTIGGTTYTPAEIGTLRGTVEPNAVAPVVTLGWTGKLKRGFTLGVEAGAMFQGAAKITNLRANGLLGSDAAFLADIEAEEEEIEDDIDDYKVWPVVQILVLYRF
jgi:hypothetical protein